MYVSPFLAGVLTVIGLELLAFFITAIFYAKNDKNNKNE